MLPVMSSAPRGKFRALSLYSFRGLSPVYIVHVKSITNAPLLVQLYMHKHQIYKTLHIMQYSSILSTILTVNSVKSVNLLFGCSLWSADDLKHGALWLGCLWGQRIIIRVPLLICLRTVKTEKLYPTFSTWSGVFIWHPWNSVWYFYSIVSMY